MTEILFTLINICSSIIDVKNKLFNSDRKKELSEWIYLIGNNIEVIADFLDDNEYPHKTCARMEEAAYSFSSVIGNTLSEEEKEHLEKLLFSAIQVEKIFAEYSNLKRGERTIYIRELYIISGSVLGIADTLKYQK
jgi:hypothetical protein